MASEFQTIALVGRTEDARVLEPMQALAEHLRGSGITVIADARVASSVAADAVEESALAAALTANKIDYQMNAGDGAFYRKIRMEFGIL